MKPMKIVLTLCALTVAFGGGFIARTVQSERAGIAANAPRRQVLYYVDPMHPAYKSDKPGIAPDCGMQLEPVYADGVAEASPSGRQALYYRDPQQPAYIADKPGLNPHTGNTLEPVYERNEAPGASGAFKVSPERQQLIGVTFAMVEVGGATRSIRTVGRVAVDETRVGHVHTRIDGWIEKVFVDFTGDVVKKGDSMLTIYSPEMLASQEELLLAARAKDVMPSLFDAARRRLQLWDLSDDQIDQVLQTGQPIRSIAVHAPMDGFVTERRAFPNQKVTPDSDLYTITDLSRVWIVADVFESDITSIKVGDSADVMFSNASAPSLRAKVSYIQPQVDPTTRTLKVRLDVGNPGTRMKPDMFVNVEFGVVKTAQLTVPSEAVLDTGDRQTVFVDLGGGYLEPRHVTLGERFGDRVAITRGVTVGERVVASGTFLIDSESQLKATANVTGASQHQHGETSTTSSTQPDPSTPAARQEHGRD